MASPTPQSPVAHRSNTAGAMAHKSTRPTTGARTPASLRTGSQNHISLNTEPLDTDPPAIETFTAQPSTRLATGRSRRRFVAVVATAITTLAVVLTGQAPASAQYGDGVVQPGDRFGDSYCTVGPAVGNFVFTPKHCGWIEGQGDAPTGNWSQSGSDISRFESADWRISSVGTVPAGITIWTDCPSIRQSDGDPIVVGGCRANGVDLPIAGVIQPWVGLTVSKSGATTGVTSGQAASSPNTPDNPVSDGAVFVQGMYVCRGDSGAVAYAEVDGAIYQVGMVTGGYGSLAVGQAQGSYHENEKACYRTINDDNLGAVISIEHLCRQLSSPERDNCLIEAGSPRGLIKASSNGAGGALISAMGFDPDTAGTASLGQVEMFVDGRRVQRRRSDSSESERFGLWPGRKWGFAAKVKGLDDGVHQMCIRFLNDPNTEGVDVEKCAPLVVCQGRPTDSENLVADESNPAFVELPDDCRRAAAGDDKIVDVYAEATRAAKARAARAAKAKAAREARAKALQQAAKAKAARQAAEARGTGSGTTAGGPDEAIPSATAERSDARAVPTSEQEAMAGSDGLQGGDPTSGSASGSATDSPGTQQSTEAGGDGAQCPVQEAVAAVADLPIATLRIAVLNAMATIARPEIRACYQLALPFASSQTRAPASRP